MRYALRMTQSEERPASTAGAPAHPAEPTPAPETNVLTRFRSRGFFPADFAAIESGKVYASGAYWSALRFQTFPATLSMMALVAVIEVPFHANQADHVLEMGLVDSDDQPRKFQVVGTFRSAPKLEHKYGAPGLVPLAVPVQGLTFELPGDYSFTLSVDNRPLDRYRFTVLRVANLGSLRGPASPGAE